MEKPIDDEELLALLREMANGLRVQYVALDTGRVTEIKPSRRPEPNQKPN